MSDHHQLEWLQGISFLVEGGTVTQTIRLDSTALANELATWRPEKAIINQRGLFKPVCQYAKALGAQVLNLDIRNDRLTGLHSDIDHAFTFILYIRCFNSGQHYASRRGHQV